MCVFTQCRVGPTTTNQPNEPPRPKVALSREADFFLGDRVLQRNAPEKKWSTPNVKTTSSECAADPRIFSVMLDKKQLPPLWQAAGRQVGWRGVCVLSQRPPIALPEASQASQSSPKPPRASPTGDRGRTPRFPRKASTARRRERKLQRHADVSLKRVFWQRHVRTWARHVGFEWYPETFPPARRRERRFCDRENLARHADGSVGKPGVLVSTQAASTNSVAT